MGVQKLSALAAAELVKSGSRVMIGGFLNCGSPNSLLNSLAKREVNNLTIISNDTSFPGKGLGKLIDNNQISELYVSHIGTHPGTGQQMNEGKIKINLIPQGTLAERIRAAGFGLGGILTPTGVGTKVQENKQTIEVQGKSYLLELPLAADIALIKAYKADKMGNLVYRGAARNFNPLMATAASIVIAEVEQIVETGEIDPDHIITPAVFIDYLVQSEK